MKSDGGRHVSHAVQLGRTLRRDRSPAVHARSLGAWWPPGQTLSSLRGAVVVCTTR